MQPSTITTSNDSATLTTPVQNSQPSSFAKIFKKYSQFSDSDESSPKKKEVERKTKTDSSKKLGSSQLIDSEINLDENKPFVADPTEVFQETLIDDVDSDIYFSNSDEEYDDAEGDLREKKKNPSIAFVWFK